MHEFAYHSPDEAATERLGIVLAEVLLPGTVVDLNGPLGAGKTRLAKAIAVALGVPGDMVTSPTFVLINEYRQGRMPVFHFDAYRLRDRDEFSELGPEEYFEGDGVCLIEWADRVIELLPTDRLTINIEVVGTTGRVFRMVEPAKSTRSVLPKVASRLS